MSECAGATPIARAVDQHVGDHILKLEVDDIYFLVKVSPWGVIVVFTG